MNIKVWNIEEMCGYKTMTTFYEDFSIADIFGKPAIIDTYKRAFKEWKSDYKYLTELIMVLNWKMWEHSEDNIEYSKLYQEIWETADKYAQEHLTGEELRYFYRTTD